MENKQEVERVSKELDDILIAYRDRVLEAAPAIVVYEGRKPFIKQILAVVEVKADDQSLPDRGINVCANCWIQTQQDMLKSDKGCVWVKVIPKGV